MAIRYEFQTELFGLTADQRQDAIAQIAAAAASHRVDMTGEFLNREQDSHGVIEYFCQASFTARGSIDSFFDSVVAWAKPIATDTDVPFLRHSYVRLTQVDDGPAWQISRRYVESPDWVEQDTTEPL